MLFDTGYADSSPSSRLRGRPKKPQKPRPPTVGLAEELGIARLTVVPEGHDPRGVRPIVPISGGHPGPLFGWWATSFPKAPKASRFGCRSPDGCGELREQGGGSYCARHHALYSAPLVVADAKKGRRRHVLAG